MPVKEVTVKVAELSSTLRPFTFTIGKEEVGGGAIAWSVFRHCVQMWFWLITGRGMAVTPCSINPSEKTDVSIRIRALD